MVIAFGLFVGGFSLSSQSSIPDRVIVGAISVGSAAVVYFVAVLLLRVVKAPFQQIGALRAEVKELREQTVGLVIIKAEWGTAVDRDDVTGLLRRLVDNGRLDTSATTQVLGDPYPGEAKTLHVTYSCYGTERTEHFPEGNSVFIGG